MAKMDDESMDIPERYVDKLVEEFAYDPVRLPPTEDPAQVLYNRRTLEIIWDAKHEALNPFTRQPLDIGIVIPQGELRKEMHEYIANSSNITLTLGLDVIPDYTQVLSEREMKILMTELISEYQCIVNAEKEKRDPQGEHYWKGLWKKFNLLRLYCQYRQENRDVFRSISGYEYLLQIIDKRFYFLCYDNLSACDVLKEVGKILDVMGLKDDNLPTDRLLWVIPLLYWLVKGCEHLKIKSMVLRIYRRIFYEFNIETLSGLFLEVFCHFVVKVSLYILGCKNLRDIANEDLYNGMQILKAVWMKHQNGCVRYNLVPVLVDSLILCISRLHSLRDAAITDECGPRMKKGKIEDGEAAVCDDEAKNVHLIKVALEGGLSIIDSIVTATCTDVRKNQFFSRSKEILQKSDIVREILGMVELVLVGFKCVWSSHLVFVINIVASLLQEEEDSERRNDVVRVFGDFLGSDIVDEYDSNVKLLLQDFMQHANKPGQT